jgi:uncharacterized cupin superfamily protein
MKTITSFQTNPPVPEFDRPRPDRLVSGNPARTTWPYFESANKAVSAGIWACEPGCWRIAFAENKDEFFCVIEGRVRLHDEAGQITEVGPGEAAVIPAGFVGKFEVVAAVRKYYVLAEV